MHGLQVIALYFTDTIKLKPPTVLEGDVESQAGRGTQLQEEAERRKQQAEQERHHGPGAVEMSNGGQGGQKKPTRGSSQRVLIGD